MPYITTPVYTPPNRVTCVPGYASETTCKILVATIYNPTTDVVSVVVNGVTYVSGTDFTLTARGTVCWTGVLTVTGLSAFMKYSWAVSQTNTAQGKTWTDSGSLHTNTADTTKNFTYLFHGCDNNTTYTNNTNTTPWRIPGSWQHEKAYAQNTSNPPVVGCAFVDDLGYVDLVQIEDNNSTFTHKWPNSSGFSMGFSTAGTTPTLDNYMIGWCALLGMLGPEQTTFDNPVDTWSDLSGSNCQSLLYVLWAREENRAWCRKNINMWPQWGDHEVKDDMGWDLQPTGNNWTYGKQSWEVTYGLIAPPLNGVAAPRDTVAKHWVFKFGNTTIFSMDFITNAVRDAGFPWGSNSVPSSTGTATSITTTRFTSLAGNNQIDDILEAVDTLASPFTIWAAQMGLRYLVARTDGSPPYITFTDTVNEYGYGSQHPIFDHCFPEYQRLMTATGNTLPSLMDPRSKCNGTTGNLVVVESDLHRAQALYHHHPAYAGNAAENFYFVNHGGGSSAHGNTPGWVAGDDKAHVRIDYYSPGSAMFHGTRFVVDDNGKCMTVKLSDRDDSSLWEKRFYPRSANHAFDADHEHPQIRRASRRALR